MYYQEKMIDDVPHCRTTPDGEWRPVVHRATPEQWELIDDASREVVSASYIKELRARVERLETALLSLTSTVAKAGNDHKSRIEALEVAQLEQTESHRFCTDAIVRRVEALELAHRVQSGTLTSAERAELGVVPVANMEAAARRAAAEACDAVMVDLSHLSDAEREQMAQELAKPSAWRPLEVETTYGTGDAQRIAQELLKPRAMVVMGSFEHGGKQFSYEAEAMEAERPPHQDKLDRLIALDREDPTPDPAMAELCAASAEAQGFAILSWSEERQPCEECHYNHCIAETPFGRFLISWKGWKEHPAVTAVTADETPFGDWFECWNSVEEAKSGCQSEYNRRLALVSLPQLQPEPRAASAEAQPAGGVGGEGDGPD